MNTLLNIGTRAAGTVFLEPLPTGSDLVNYWQARLPKAETAILEVLHPRFPHGLDKETLAAECGYEPTGGGFNNALGRLRTLELITRGTAEIKLSDHLFA